MLYLQQWIQSILVEALKLVWPLEMSDLRQRSFLFLCISQTKDRGCSNERSITLDGTVSFGSGQDESSFFFFFLMYVKVLSKMFLEMDYNNQKEQVFSNAVF